MLTRCAMHGYSPPMFGRCISLMALESVFGMLRCEFIGQDGVSMRLGKDRCCRNAHNTSITLDDRGMWDRMRAKPVTVDQQVQMLVGHGDGCTTGLDGLVHGFIRSLKDIDLVDATS